MDRETLNKVWTAITLGAAYLTVNAFLQTQGWHFVMPGPNFDKVGRYSATVYGILLPWPLWMSSLALMSVCARRSVEPTIVSRLPVPFNVSVTLPDRVGRAYVWIGSALMVLVPILLNVHLILKFFAGTAFKLDPCKPLGVGFWGHLNTWSEFTGSFGRNFVYEQCNGIDYFPGVTPTVLLAAELALLYMVVRTLFVLLWTRTQVLD